MIKIQNELNIQIENASIKILRFPFLRSTQRVIVLDNEEVALAINNQTHLLNSCSLKLMLINCLENRFK